jgi:hypothetical protein
VESGRVVGNVDMQVTLKATVAKLSASSSIDTSARYANILTTLEKNTRLTLPKMNGRIMLTKNRRFAKLAIAVEWAITEIISFSPTDPLELIKHSDHISKKLLAKGIGGPKGVELPKFLTQVLDAMIAKGHKLHDEAGAVPKVAGAT